MNALWTSGAAAPLQEAAWAPAAAAPAAPAVVVDREQQLLTEAAVKFEAFFVAQMLKQMRQATAAIADRDAALNREVNQAALAMADNAVADTLSGQRAFGIADVLVRQMRPAAAVPQAATTPTV